MSVPQDIAPYLPHRPPLRFVQSLLECTKDEVITEGVFGPDSIVVDRERVVDNAALLELVAQSYAALRGFEDQQRGFATANGYLVGITQFTAHAAAHAGEALRVAVRTTGVFEDFFVGEGRVTRAGELIAEGTLKVWMQKD